MPLTQATNTHEWSLILATNSSTSLAQPCWWEYAKYSKIKTDVMKYLEPLAATDPPRAVDVSIIDVMFFLRLHPNLPNTVDAVAWYILARIAEFEEHILHFVCNKWVHPSIKDCERKENILVERPYTKRLDALDAFKMARCVKKQHFRGITD